MKEFSLKEASYAFMVAIANVDQNVTTVEKYVIDHFFDDKFNFFKLSDEKKKIIGSELRRSLSREKYNELIVTALKKEKKEKQMEAFELVCKFIYTNCPKSTSSWAEANEIQRNLDFSMEEYKEYEVWKAKS